MTAPLTDAREIVKAEIHAAEVQWRSQADGVLNLQELLGLIENRFTRALAQCREEREQAKGELMVCEMANDEAQAMARHWEESCGRQADIAREQFARADAATAALAAAREVVQAFVTKLDVLTPAIDGAFAFQANHGFPYSGPTWVDELTALRALLTPQAPGQREEGT